MKSPLEALPEISDKMDGWKVVADMNAAHLTLSDRDLLDSDVCLPSLIGVFRYGWFVTTDIPDERQFKLRNAGFSETYIHILKTLRDRSVYYVAFDTDAPVWPDFRTYECPMPASAGR